MSHAGNGSVKIKQNGKNRLWQLEHDEKNMAAESLWSAIPDLVLTLIPTAILVATGDYVGKE